MPVEVDAVLNITTHVNVKLTEEQAVWLAEVLEHEVEWTEGPKGEFLSDLHEALEDAGYTSSLDEWPGEGMDNG